MKRIGLSIEHYRKEPSRHSGESRIGFRGRRREPDHWIPAFAGMTILFSQVLSPEH